MSSTTADTYPESVGSCRPPTPPPSPPHHPAPAAIARGAPVRRQLDFADDAVADLEDFDDFLIRAVDDIERGYNEAKRRAPPCVCGRGDCGVQRDDQRGEWMYVCSAQPKCKHVAMCKEVDQDPQSPPAIRGDLKPSNVAMCKEVDQNPQSPPAIRSDPKPSNPCVFDVPSTPVADARAQINNVNLRGAGATTPVNYTLKGVGTTTPVHVSPQGAGATAVVKVSPRWTRSNDGRPICQCTAGKCKVLKLGNEDYYVCPIPKGQGACSFKVPVIDAVKEPPQIGDNNIMETYGNNAVRVRDNNANGSANPAQPNDDEWPFDIINNEIVLTAQATPGAVVHQKSTSTPCQQIAKSPMTPYDSRPCFGCGEIGHWISACPKPSPRNSCFHCGMVGHRRANCPQLRGS